MDYEKRFNEALKRAEAWRDKNYVPIESKNILDDIFPELKEREDKFILESILTYLYWLEGSPWKATTTITNQNYMPRGLYTIQDMIAWLEDLKLKINKKQENNG